MAAPHPDEILHGLDPEQREVATTFDGPVVVIAGAGTGKTRAITHRIAYGALTGALDASATLAVTFTTRAAGEMRGRLATLGVTGVQSRTFHLRDSPWLAKDQPSSRSELVVARPSQLHLDSRPRSRLDHARW